MRETNLLCTSDHSDDHVHDMNKWVVTKENA